MSKSPRLLSIDALRGFVMLIMLLDHVRETFFLHRQVTDPVDAATVEVALFYSRFASSLCAPAFILLTGLGAWLYGQARSRREVSAYLFKRGCFLVLLEILVITPAWTGEFPPQTFYLQVIWAIGLSMIALAGLIHLPRKIQVLLAILIVAGHNLLGGIRLAEDELGHLLWAVLYQREWLEFGEVLRARTSYPILPWIGVILLGYTLGPWFSKATPAPERRRKLLYAGAGFLLTFFLLRTINIYGDLPWEKQETMGRTIMAYLALTKYPVSLLFLLLTLGVSAFLLVLFERCQERACLQRLALFGAAPMFFYVLHLSLLKVLYLTGYALFGANQGDYYGVQHIEMVWLWALGLSGPLIAATSAFARLKRRRRDLPWLSYF